MKFIESFVIPDKQAFVDLLTESPDALLIIGGMPGAGKSSLRLWASHALSKMVLDHRVPQPAFYDIDDWSRPVETGSRLQWMIDSNKIPAPLGRTGCVVISGNADNLAESVPFIAATFGKTKIICVFVSRQYRPFIKTHQLRSRVDGPFKAAWERMARFSRSDYKHSRARFRANLMSKLSTVVHETMPSGSLSFFDMESAEDPAQVLRAWA